MNRYLKILKKINYPAIITLLVILLAVVLILFLAYYIIQIYHLRKFRKDAVILKITPLDTCEIGNLERMLMFLHGMLLNTQWRVLTEGRPYISFEVVGRHQKIEFFLWVPMTYARSIQEQIYISYPDCVIEEAEDHMVPLLQARRKMRELNRMIKSGEVDKAVKKLMIRGMTVKRGYNFTFPFADKVDIIPSILAAMSGLEWHEKIVLQVLLRPLDRKWQVRGRDKIKRFEKKGHKPDSNGIRLDGFTRDIMDELDLDGHDTFSPTRDLTRADRKEIREATEKILKSGYEATIRILGIGFFGKGIATAVRSVAAAFSKLDHINRFKRRRIIFFRSLYYVLVQMRLMRLYDRMNVLTPGELAGFALRLPDRELRIKEIIRNKHKQLPPPMMRYEQEKNLIGEIQYRGLCKRIGVKPDDARRHVHVIGGIGTGKSEELKSMARQAINDGKGVIVMEPHGKLVDEIAQLVPEERQKDVLYFDFSDSEYPVPFNFMKVQQGKNKRKSKSDLIDETAEEFLNIMKNIFSDSWGIRTEKIFRHTGKALMEAGEGGLWNAKQMLKNKDYRSKVVKKVKNIAVKDFWTTEFTGKTASDGTFRLDSDIRNAIDSPLTKIDRFLSSERVLYMVGQEECIDFDECINSNKIVLFKIPKGDLKEDNTKFLGNIIFSKLMMAFMSRTPEEMKHETLMIADEVQNFVTTNPKDFELLMDELRKYGVCFVMAHQRVPQIQSIISAVRDNVGTTVCFRLGEESSSYMQKSFDGFLECKDLEKLENRYAYVKTLVDGKKTDPFLIKTLDKEDVPDDVANKRLSTIIELNRRKRRSKDEIEKELRKKIEDFDTAINDFKQEMDDDYISAFTGSGNDEQDGAYLPDEWS